MSVVEKRAVYLIVVIVYITFVCIILTADRYGVAVFLSRAADTGRVRRLSDTVIRGPLEAHLKAEFSNRY